MKLAKITNTHAVGMCVTGGAPRIIPGMETTVTLGASAATAAFSASMTPRALRHALDSKFPLLHDLRTTGNHRRFTDADIIRLALARVAMSHGFDLSEAARILALTVDPLLRARGDTPGLAPTIADKRATAVHSESGALHVRVADVTERLPYEPYGLQLRIGLIAAEAVRRRHAVSTLKLSTRPRRRINQG